MVVKDHMSPLQNHGLKCPMFLTMLLCPPHGVLQRPMVVKDHMYDSRIVDIKFHSSINGRAGQHVISSDRHIIKVPLVG